MFIILLLAWVEAIIRGKKVEAMTAGPVAFVANAVLSWAERDPGGIATAALLTSMSNFP